VYGLFNVVVFWMMPSISMRGVTIGFWQVAEGPLVPQIITGYPLWGMALLTILRKFPNLFGEWVNVVARSPKERGIWRLFGIVLKAFAYFMNGFS
jgi:hypothetical protein